MKDNQTEDIEANEIYYEGNQLNNYNMNVVNYGNNNQYGQEMYDNINNEQNDMENENYNEEEEYKDEQEIQDYNNIYQFQDVIEEEDNENFTVEESNKTKSIKTGNFSINKSNLNNRDYINNELNFEEENNANIPRSQKEKMKNINLIEGNNLNNEQNNKELKSNKK